MHILAWRETLASLGRTLPADFLARHQGMTTEQIVRSYNETYDDCLDPDQISREKNRRVYATLAAVQEIPVVAELARRHAGVLPMTVASGGKASNVHRTLEATGLAPLFAVVLTADDDVRPKPAPDLFLAAAHRLGVEPRYCQVFEDGDPGLRAARAAGMIATDIRPLLGSHQAPYEPSTTPGGNPCHRNPS
jgi:beta-phosphoglucomutase-like phosphatase (HAD superfamily)